MIKLKCIATYKDGGSKTFIGSDGNHYWQDFSLNSKNTSNYGKIFQGKMDKSKRIPAVGEFEIDEYKRKYKTYRQRRISQSST